MATKRQAEVEALPNFASFSTIPKNTLFSVKEAGGLISDAGILAIASMLWREYKDLTYERQAIVSLWPAEGWEDADGDDPTMPEELWDWWEDRVIRCRDAETEHREVYDIFSEAVKDGGFDRAWLVPKGEYAGTFPKRFASMAKKAYSFKVRPAILQEIGTIAKANTSAEGVRYLDVTTSLDWNDGEFGDEGSCYWGGREGARVAITENGGGALRLWSKLEEYEGRYQGKGRCWYAPKGQYFVIWNAYGPPDMQLIGYARVIATAMGVSYKRVGLSCDGNSDGLVYINGGSGYAIGKPDVIDELGHVDLRWDAQQYNTEGRDCDNCGDHVPEDNIHWHDDSAYCEGCYNDLVTSCDQCGRDIRWDDAHNVADTTYCRRCYGNHTDDCQCCGERYHNDDLEEITLDSGDIMSVCSGCRDNEYGYCNTCDAYYEPSEEHTCPKDDDRPAPPMETIEIKCYQERTEGVITLPKAYLKVLMPTGVIFECNVCSCHHMVDEFARNDRIRTYNELGRAMNGWFGYREERGAYV